MSRGWCDIGAVPVVTLGFSFGACLAYECVRTVGLLATENPAIQVISHMIQIAGPTREDLENVTLFDNTAKSFGDSLLANMG